ncbi:phosphoethanolamine transferase domain-containing protein [Helicobacter sp.]|uniref:phosphoethanolamine transferase domain-containing protein n=1 Tax=Helicobacter sp. TaxID=218 RepID=UPI00199BBF5F|nr:phosphoethanolamine transferase domain-containing protein [Helicobacter sp.]MBD5165283.1 DUF1705 domain-containing protein [Helicobacter sp.]
MQQQTTKANQHFLDFLWQNLPSVCYLFACSTIPSMYWYYFTYSSNDFVKKCLEAFLTGALLEILILCLVFYIFHRFARYILYFLCFVGTFLFIVEIFLVKYYSALITPDIIEVLVQTNPKEAKEFLITFINLKILGLVCGFILLSFVYFKLFTTNPKRFCIKAKWNKIFVYSLLIISIFLIANKSYLALVRHRPSSFENTLMRYSLTRIPYSLIQFYHSFRDMQETIANYQAIRESYQGKISKSKDSPKHIVLVIGESAQRNFLNAYGYPLLNTPYLNALINNVGGGGR